MKKRLLSMALLAAIAMGSVSVTSHAAEAKTTRVQVAGCYKLFTGTEIESLQQILDKLNSNISNPGTNCPDIEKPDVEKPDDVETPDAEKPGDAEAPDTEKPGDAETPDAEKPGDAEAPDTEKPGDAEIPDAEKPGDVEAPDTEKPDDAEKPDDTETSNGEKPGSIETSGMEKPGDAEESKADQTNSTALSYARQVVKLVNEERAKAGLSALELQADITAAANVRAKEIKQKFSHTRPNGSSFSSVLKEQGVSFRGAGENIAYGQKTPEQVMEGWMNSEGHRANILNSKFKNIGVGYYQDERGVNHWVQLFTY